MGLLIDRRGKVEYVIAGDRKEIVIPALKRVREGSGRLRGVRLVHTHLDNEPLSRDDLNDLVMLRLDMMTAVGMGLDGSAMNFYTATVNPDPGQNEPWTLHDPVPISSMNLHIVDTVTALEKEFSRRDARKIETGELSALLVHISTLSKEETGARISELKELARTEGVIATDVVSFRGDGGVKSLVGEERLKQLVIKAMSIGADMILFDQELSPSQSKYIGSVTDKPLMDRTQLILRIFGRRAHTADGKLRVEMARLKYLLPRIGAKDDALSRIRGGIGMRGPGETAMEVSRRRIKERVKVILGKLKKLESGRTQRRNLRKRTGVAQVAIIGYTNAGKSTLLNAITKSSAKVEDKLFATLDPTSRRVRFPRDVDLVISDTVGFIRALPEHLLDAFRSTLEELNDADLLIHLVDISSTGFRMEIETVESILGQLGLSTIPRLIVLNKVDKADPETAENESNRYGAPLISASERIGLESLVIKIIEVGSFESAPYADSQDNPIRPEDL